jgi:hypothetical protein
MQEQLPMDVRERRADGHLDNRGRAQIAEAMDGRERSHHIDIPY